MIFISCHCLFKFPPSISSSFFCFLKIKYSVHKTAHKHTQHIHTHIYIYFIHTVYIAAHINVTNWAQVSLIMHCRNLVPNFCLRQPNWCCGDILQPSVISITRLNSSSAPPLSSCAYPPSPGNYDTATSWSAQIDKWWGGKGIILSRESYASWPLIITFFILYCLHTSSASGSFGLGKNSLENIINLSNRIWSCGPLNKPL